MFRAVCVVSVLLSAGAAFGLPVEMVTNGDLEGYLSLEDLITSPPLSDPFSPYASHEPPWGGPGKLVWDARPVSPVYAVIIGSWDSYYYQMAQQTLSYNSSDFAGKTLEASADLQAWTTNDNQESATTTVKLAFDNSSLGAGWQYLDLASYTSQLHADAGVWHSVTGSHTFAPDFNAGDYGGILVVWSESASPALCGWAFDNVSVLSTPEPGTVALLLTGLLGMVIYAWRKRR